MYMYRGSKDGLDLDRDRDGDRVKDWEGGRMDSTGIYIHMYIFIYI
jgi:hypothetical protein